MRHGQSVANAHKTVSGDQETPLSELGRHQVRIQAEKLMHLGIDLIVCSPLHRALDTAKIVAETIQYPEREIRIIEELKERHLGDLEGRSYASDEQDAGNTSYVDTVANVEPLDQFHSRVYAAFRDIGATRHHKNVLIVCHQNVARMLQVVAQGLEPSAIYDMPRVENAHTERLI